MNRARSVPRLLLAACVACGGVFALLYFNAFADCVQSGCGTFLLPYNVPDHFIYATVIDGLDDIAWWLPIASNHGVGVLYGQLLLPLAGVTSDGLIGFSFVVNMSVYAATLWLYVRLAQKLFSNTRSVVFLAFYPPFLFFSALINKDIFLTFLLLAIAWCLMERRYGWLALVTSLLALVRVQYCVLPLLSWVLVHGRFARRFVLLYVVTSLGAALLTRFSSVFDVVGANASSGITDLIYALNRNYLVGSLLLNPLRAIQYPLSLAQGWTLVFNAEGIDLMKLTEGLTFFWFVGTAPGVYRFMRRSKRSPWSYEERVLRAMICAFALILLLTSITEPRYLMALYPLLLLAAVRSLRLSPRRARRRHPAPITSPATDAVRRDVSPTPMATGNEIRCAASTAS